MINISIYKSTLAAFAVGFIFGFTRKVSVKLKKAKETAENKNN